MDYKEREKHKYVARVKRKKTSNKKKNNWRYFYTKEEYQAYLNGKKGKKSIDDKISGFFSSGKKFTEKFLKSTKKNAEKISKDISKSAKEISKDISKSAKEISKDISKSAKEISKDISSAIKKTSLKIEKKVEKTIGKAEKMTTFGAKKVKKSMEKIGSNSVDKLETFKDRAISIGKTSVALAASTLKNQKLYDSIMEKVNETTQPVKDFDDLKTKKKNQSDEEDMAEVNQNYKSNMYEYTNNCAYCTMAYEMRQRGYDVEANPIDPMTVNTIDDIASWYEGEDPYQVSVLAVGPEIAAAEVEKHLASYGDGARGQFCTYWIGGGGHSVAWEVVDGDVVLRDCQTNETVDVIDYLQYSTDATFFRTDNLELTEEALKCVRNR